MADDPADDEARSRDAEWSAENAKTVADNGAVPLAVEVDTPRPEHTGKIRLTPQQFADKVEMTDRDAYARGFEHGRAAAHAEAEAAAVTELRKVREDSIETVRQLFVIFEVGYPDWETAERWIRSRLTPL
jgi:flagellar biosynthesis/type III secretory pathway protein FliH